MSDQKHRFAELGFEDFRRMAQDEGLSQYEKIGFPDSYRADKEELILADIMDKMPAMVRQKQVILDVGPGCSGLSKMVVDQCDRQGSELILVDSAEMLNHIADAPFIRKFPAFYPKCDDLFDEYRGKVDGIIVYSVFHYLFEEANVWDFLDRSLELLNHGGQMLIGDIPNVSKRKRFFASSTGVRFHQEFTGEAESVPSVDFNTIEQGKIDDGVIFGLLMRARLAGFDAYLVPQRESLPMANRREDILIVRP